MSSREIFFRILANEINKTPHKNTMRGGVSSPLISGRSSPRTSSSHRSSIKSSKSNSHLGKKYHRDYLLGIFNNYYDNKHYTSDSKRREAIMKDMKSLKPEKYRIYLDNDGYVENNQFNMYNYNRFISGYIEDFDIIARNKKKQYLGIDGFIEGTRINIGETLNKPEYNDYNIISEGIKRMNNGVSYSDNFKEVYKERAKTGFQCINGEIVSELRFCRGISKARPLTAKNKRSRQSSRSASPSVSPATSGISSRQSSRSASPSISPATTGISSIRQSRRSASPSISPATSGISSRQSSRSASPSISPATSGISSIRQSRRSASPSISPATTIISNSRGNSRQSSRSGSPSISPATTIISNSRSNSRQSRRSASPSISPATSGISSNSSSRVVSPFERLGGGLRYINQDDILNDLIGDNKGIDIMDFNLSPVSHI